MDFIKIISMQTEINKYLSIYLNIYKKLDEIEANFIE